MRQRSFALLVVCLAVAGCDGDEPVTSSTTGSTAPAGTTTTGSTSSTAATTPAMPSTPDAYATAFIAAWVAADRDAASALATPEVVDQLFAVDAGEAPWALVTCEGAAGSSYCTFGDGAGGEIVVRVGNEAAALGQPQAIAEVRVG